MLQTILSRVQMHRLGRLSEKEISEALSTGSDDGEQMEKLAHLADGDLNLAKNLLEDQASISASINFFIRWMRACFVLNLEILQELNEEFNALGREQQKALLAQSETILRKVLMYRTLPETKTKLLKEELEFIHKFSRFIQVENTASMLEALNEAHYHIERNANARITFADLSFQMSDSLMSQAMN
jgi:DNA polymerase-3 subunit delta'